MTFSAKDGKRLVIEGEKRIKKPNPVYMEKQLQSFTVETNEGVLNGQAGDYVAHDPISGHVWPVAASYVQQHYESPLRGDFPDDYEFDK